jgi:soluble P-type ATPase
MLNIDIPGYREIEAEHLVLDYNGTLAIDGKLIEGVKPLLEIISRQLNIHILTADTFGTSKNELVGVPCQLEILKPESQDVQKEQYVLALGKERVIAVGNGQNDALMLHEASLGILVIQHEGAFLKLAGDCEIVCIAITDALSLLLNPLRMVATLRK